MTFHCRACRSNVQPAGKARGFRFRDHTCPCGGSLARGRTPSADVLIAVPVKLEERGVADERLGLKRSKARPLPRGAARLELIVALASLGPLVVVGLVIGGILWWKSRRLDLGHRIICRECGGVIANGPGSTTFDECFVCRLRRRWGLA